MTNLVLVHQMQSVLQCDRVCDYVFQVHHKVIIIYNIKVHDERRQCLCACIVRDQCITIT